MKKLFAIAIAALVNVSLFAATLTLNGTWVSDPENYFTKGEKANFNAKYTGAEYAGITFTSGLKMESATAVNFTTTGETNITIVQSTWSDKTINFDGAALAVADAEAGTGCRIYTLSKIAAGDHSITRGSGESGLFYVKVEDYAPADHSKATVRSISIDGKKLSDFDAATLEYNIELDYGTTVVPTVTAVAGDDATIDVTPAASLPGTTSVKCTSYDESATVTYKINFTLSKPLCAAPTITISEEWNEENEGYLVTLKNNEEGATLSYSVDGGDFAAYVAPFYVDSRAVVTAKASKEGFKDATAEAKAPFHYLSRILESDEFAWVAGDTVSEQYHLVAPNITVILNDNSWQGGSKAGNDPDVPEEFGYTASVAGSNNPSAKNNIPISGCFYTFVPSKDGSLEIGAKINADKVIFVSEEGTLLTVKVNGTEVESGSKVSTTENTYGKVVFNVKKDVNYYFWGSGTKIPFFGFKFEKSSETAIENTVVGEKAVKMIENGKLVIIKNGVKYDAQGAVVR